MAATPYRPNSKKLSESAVANARLIASGPDLLGALRDALSALEEYEERSLTLPSDRATTSMVKARAAIAKAGGV